METVTSLQMQVDRFGGPEELHGIRVGAAAPAPGTVAIEVAASDVLQFDTMLRRGLVDAGLDLPWVPGDGIAGRVVAVADDVEHSWLGRRVAAHTGNRGGYAERAVVPATALVAVPDALGLDTAAALTRDAPTALALLEHTEVGPADAVLVVGTSGGLGLTLLQLARTRARRVVALARDPGKMATVRAQGPDAVVDTDRPDWVETVRAELGGGADVVLDNVGGSLGETAYGLVAAGGRFSGHGAPSGAFAAVDPARAAADGVRVSGIEVAQFTPERLTALAERALTLASAGEIDPVIGQRFALADAAGAHRAIEQRRTLGKTLLVTAQR